MTITKTTNYNASLADANGIGYATFTGSIDAIGVPTTNYYINDKDTYKANIKAFRAGLQEFQNAVFADADALAVQAAAAKEA
ncbi:hypothetical protein [Weissella confusa]|uniref:Uncharacterized protein n=1 Tax=Weissella confusa TaxID=1583 RepID=A0A4Z0S0Z5_WEICO|nr:hypothetical protein [Weissella confusa]TGE74918.1 hypothetical protein C6P11_02725 [Weissella confusa]